MRCLESRSTEMALKVLVDTKLNISQQCALEAKRANSFLDCVRKTTTDCSRACSIP